jgi:uncharacterized protein (DUF2249 family)
MTTSSETIDLTHFDVRTIPCRVKHGQIFERWAALPVGGYFVLINDHDPVPLYYQFAAQFPGAFTWEYLAPEGDEFRVKIARVAESPAVPLAPPPAPPGRIPLTPAAADEVDARGLEPPEPMLRILEAAETLPAGRTLRARTDRKPLNLLPELENRGLHYTCEAQADGSWLTTLCRR